MNAPPNHRTSVEEVERLYHEFFLHCHDAVFIVDIEEDSILDVNPAACRLLGYPKGELLKLGMREIHPHEIEKVRQFRQQVLDAGTAWTNELSCRTKAEDVVPAEMSAVAITYGGKARLVAFVRDIRRRKQLEAELRRNQEELEEKVRRRTADLKAANHELEELRDRLQQENQYLREEVSEELSLGSVVGRSQALKGVLKQASQVAKTDATVLIHGETGTGKEVIARYIHEHSPRAEGPLIKVNCGGIPRELFESEFFGHIKGAFTGAHNDRAGRFELADGGTLFLDEVGEIPLALQSKLLRVLQESAFERVGEGYPHTVNVRIVAATNRDLRRAAEEERFRQDLFYRLNVFPLDLPPLRERPADIKPLALHFLEHACRRLNCIRPDFSDKDVAILENYDWPGNARELRNVIERAIILTTDGKLDFSPLIPIQSGGCRTAITRGNIVHSYTELKEIEKQTICRVLTETKGKVSGPSGAAERLGLKPTTLRSRLERFGLHPRQFR